MQLTRFADYSLRVLIFLARRNGAHTTIRDIAEAHEVSENHLIKVVHNLSKRGYVKTVRGRGGGISLARAPVDISVGRVVRDVEPLTPTDCFFSGYDAACKFYPKCELIGALRAAQTKFLATLDAYSIGDVMAPKRPGILPKKVAAVPRSPRRTPAAVRGALEPTKS